VKCFACVKRGAEQKEATLLPVMLLFASPKRFPGAPPARSVCDIPVCDEHKPEITLGYLLSDKGWDTLCHGFRMMGKVAPERAATKLEFIAIDSAEARSFLDARRKRVN
jgi:hypothetical protein